MITLLGKHGSFLSCPGLEYHLPDRHQRFYPCAFVPIQNLLWLRASKLPTSVADSLCFSEGSLTTQPWSKGRNTQGTESKDHDSEAMDCLHYLGSHANQLVSVLQTAGVCSLHHLKVRMKMVKFCRIFDSVVLHLQLNPQKVRKNVSKDIKKSFWKTFGNNERINVQNKLN